MRSAIALALTLSSAALLVAISPACSSSSSVPPGADSGPGQDATKSEGGGQKDGSIDVVQNDTTPPGDGGCVDAGNAGALLGTPACVTCLSTKCTGGNLVEQCGCEPGCIMGLECLDSCVADGGSATSCAVGCIGAIDGSAGQATGAALLGCVESTCGVCTAVPEAGITDGGDGG
jgi:hypothetical protein